MVNSHRRSARSKTKKKEKKNKETLAPSAVTAAVTMHPSTTQQARHRGDMRRTVRSRVSSLASSARRPRTARPNGVLTALRARTSAIPAAGVAPLPLPLDEPVAAIAVGARLGYRYRREAVRGD